MSRFFPLKVEQRSSQEALRERRREFGRLVLWWIHDPEASSSHPTYGEGSHVQGNEVRWHEPIKLPVISALIIEAPEARGEQGLEAVDRLSITASRWDLEVFGLGDLHDMRRSEKHYRDRIEFPIESGRIWTPYEIQQYGEIRDKDTGVIITARELSPAERSADIDFSSS